MLSAVQRDWFLSNPFMLHHSISPWVGFYPPHLVLLLKESNFTPLPSYATSLIRCEFESSNFESSSLSRCVVSIHPITDYADVVISSNPIFPHTTKGAVSNGLLLLARIVYKQHHSFIFSIRSIL